MEPSKFALAGASAWGSSALTLALIGTFCLWVGVTLALTPPRKRRK
jgi:hypothetical protein